MNLWKYIPRFQLYNAYEATQKQRQMETAMREKAENNRRADMDKTVKSDIMRAGTVSGALNDRNEPLHIRRDRHAEMYYEAVRNSRKGDIVQVIS